MYFLSLETSTKIFSLSLSRGAKVLRYRNLKSTQVLENTIISAIDKLLSDVKITFDQLDAFAIAIGPGSFTSLRVGLATVKAFCMATQKPVVGIPTLDVIAAGVTTTTPGVLEVCVMNDARRGNVYAAFYGAQGRKSDFLLLPFSDILNLAQPRTLFVGDALPLYAKDIHQRFKLAQLAPEKLWHPQAKVMAALAYARLSRGDHDHSEKLLPIYLYPEDCQVDRNVLKKVKNNGN